ncbi:hypothetical protein BYT27DRAFT_7108680, partial [Phlegmacium glaucopus]
AVANVELPAPLTWGVIKGLHLQDIRYWAKQPGTLHLDGTLTIGFCYPNQNDSTGSPYWRCESLSRLPCPRPTHPF